MLSAVHDTPEAALPACAGQPVQHCFFPSAPSISVMAQGALPVKASELKCVVMAFVFPLSHAPSTDRPASWKEHNLCLRTGKNGSVSWVSVCFWRQHKHYSSTHTQCQSMDDICTPLTDLNFATSTLQC